MKHHAVAALLASCWAVLMIGCAAAPPLQSQGQTEQGQVAAGQVDSAVTQDRLDPARLVIVTVRNVAGPTVPRAGSTQRDYDARTTYSVSPAARATARAIAVAHKLREVSSWPIQALGVHCLMFELPAGTERSAMLETLRHDRRVESAQALQTFDTLSTPALTTPGLTHGPTTPGPTTPGPTTPGPTTPGPAKAGPTTPGLTTPGLTTPGVSTPSTTYNDPYQQLQGNLQTLGIPQAHEWSRGEGVSVAVIDTAVDSTHPDLAGRIKRQQSFVDPATDAAGNAIDRVRHGTAVAGVIAAVANNQLGIVGIAPAATLFALNACWPGAELGHSSCNTFTLAKALAAAIEVRVNIINLSLAGPSDLLLTRLVNQALQRGIIVVGATSTAPGPSFPTDIEGVIGVSSALTGVTAAPANDAGLWAPGTDVLTLVPAGHYDFQSGSSLATASVSGGIALLLARDQKLSAPDVRRLLASSSQSLMTAAGETYSVNICSALASLLHQPQCRASTPPPAVPVQTSQVQESPVQTRESP